MEEFLKSVEKRAYRMACVATGDKTEALDIVQDAMEALVRKYANHDEGEWRALFFRILLNRIADSHRHKKKWSDLFRSRVSDDEDTRGMEDIEAGENDRPHAIHARSVSRLAIERAVAALPPAQQQVFMMRCWEGSSVRETANILRISEGSVKTHYFRALQKLRHELKDFFYE